MSVEDKSQRGPNEPKAPAEKAPPAPKPKVDDKALRGPKERT